MPDVMRQAGCRLVEVGATNRTHLRDYSQAINAETGLLMKVHTSNYHIEGFTHSVSEAELAELARHHGLPAATDLGSGALIDLSAYGLPAEPMPQQMIAQGVDLVSFSGDKLLGGPQAGLIIGKKSWIDKIQKHPLKRALRCDKMTLAALEATLRLYLQPDKLTRQLPTLRRLTRPQAEMQEQATRLLGSLSSFAGAAFDTATTACLSQIGSGSLPVDRLPSWAITFSARDGRGSTLEALASRLRSLPAPVIGRLYDGKLLSQLALPAAPALDQHKGGHRPAQGGSGQCPGQAQAVYQAIQAEQIDKIRQQGPHAEQHRGLERHRATLTADNVVGNQRKGGKQRH
uniref:L-seryl-tRNA(Sec) selenium transferase n=1 Tax=Anopheles coluzzii TaxID=1518534 RepID=A0A8W7PDB7_ANOCL